MRERYRLSAMALGMLLCSIIPAASYAQNRLERVEERPQVVVDHSMEAVNAAPQAGAARVAAGEVTRVNVASRAGISVQLVTLPRFQEGDTRLVGFVERKDQTAILATLTDVPADVISPSLIAEIHEGTCLDFESSSVRSTDESDAGYLLTPSPFSLRSFGAVLPVSLAALRRSAHAVTVRTGPEEEISAFACIDVV